MPFAGVQPIWLEDLVISLLSANVALAIPIFILVLKLVVLRISGDLDELFRSLAAVPLELLLIAIGLVFTGLSRTVPFESRYHSDRLVDFSGLVVVVMLSICLAAFYRLNKSVLTYFQRFFVAMDSVKLQVAQSNFKFDSNSRVTWNTAWAIAYLMASILSWVAEMAVGTFLLWQVMLRMK